MVSAGEGGTSPLQILQLINYNILQFVIIFFVYARKKTCHIYMILCILKSHKYDMFLCFIFLFIKLLVCVCVCVTAPRVTWFMFFSSFVYLFASEQVCPPLHQNLPSKFCIIYLQFIKINLSHYFLFCNICNINVIF